MQERRSRWFSRRIISFVFTTRRVEGPLCAQNARRPAGIAETFVRNQFVRTLRAVNFPYILAASSRFLRDSREIKSQVSSSLARPYPNVKSSAREYYPWHCLRSPWWNAHASSIKLLKLRPRFLNRDQRGTWSIFSEISEIQASEERTHLKIKLKRVELSKRWLFACNFLLMSFNWDLRAALTCNERSEVNRTGRDCGSRY